MKEQYNTNDLSSLGNLKTELVNNEPIKEGRNVTPTMLRSPVSKKLLKYFFTTHPEVLIKYIKKEPGKTVFIEDMKAILNNDMDLAEQNIFYLDNLYIKFLKEIPINQSSSHGVVFGKIAREAGCTGSELEEAKKILDGFIEPALNNFFNKKPEQK